MGDCQGALLIQGPGKRDGLEEEEHHGVSKGGDREEMQFASSTVDPTKTEVKTRDDERHAADPQQGCLGCNQKEETSGAEENSKEECS